MRRGRGNPQSLGAPGNGRIIDRLDVNPVPVEQEIACLLALVGITDHHRYDMRVCVQHRQPGFPQGGFGRCHGGALGRTLGLPVTAITPDTEGMTNKKAAKTLLRFGTGPFG